MPVPVWTVNNQQDGMSPRYRNIVRRIGSALPIKGAKRIHIQKSLIGFKKQEPTAIAERCPNLGDLSWVMKYSGDSCIVVKGTEFDKDESSSFEVDETLPEEPLRCSTPLNQTRDSTMFFTPDTKAMEKISQLEDELAKMRAQIASIVMAQEHSTVTPNVADNSHIGAAGPIAPPPPPPAPPMCGPPPPPPPPPPVQALPTKSLHDIIRENKAKSGGASSSSTTKPGGSLPNMSDVLKGLGKVKLNRVERSPGGTPLRQKPLPAESSDPAAMIAAALKKKFASHRRHMATPPSTPEQDKENNGFSPLASPKQFAVKSAMSDKPVVPGPHLLKNRRKSGSKRLSGGLSPSKRKYLSTVKENQCASPLSTVSQNTMVPQ